jgi:hypothetical protein
MREIGLPNAQLDESYQRSLLQATLQHEVKDQIAYHRANAEAMERVDHALHTVGNVSFLFTLWMLLAFLVIYATHILLATPTIAAWAGGFLPVAKVDAVLYAILAAAKAGMIVPAAGLPALGAAVSGIRAQGDFDGSRQRSERMVAELSDLERSFNTAIEHKPRLEDTTDMLIETARVMSEDLAAWQDLYGRKRLNLPA